MTDPEAFLKDLFLSAIAAADPLNAVPPHLPAPPKGRAVVVGAGKAAAKMAQAVEGRWPGDIAGAVVTQYGYALPTRRIEVIEAAHPVPDENSMRAARRMMEAVAGLTADDLVLCLLSGGGSSLMSLPAPGIAAEEKRALHGALVRSGAPIHEINCVRKHLSAIKGGRLALAAYPARVVTLAVSDVPGDEAAVIASGPTLPDPTTGAEALAILQKYGIPLSGAAESWLESGESETPKPGDARFEGHVFTIVSRGADALKAAAALAEKAGVAPVILGEHVEGEARAVGALHAAEALKRAGRGPCVLLSGGETTVTVRGKGRGGRNGEYILAAAMAAGGHPRVYGIAGGTDGLDGSSGAAGAMFTPQTLTEAARAGAEAAACLGDNDTHKFFSAARGLVVTGPTHTNVNDFRALLVL